MATVQSVVADDVADDGRADEPRAAGDQDFHGVVLGDQRRVVPPVTREVARRGRRKEPQIDRLQIARSWCFRKSSLGLSPPSGHLALLAASGQGADPYDGGGTIGQWWRRIWLEEQLGAVRFCGLAKNSSGVVLLDDLAADP